VKNSFIVVSDGAPGDLMAKLISVTDSGVPEVESLGKDEMDPNNGGAHPWSLEEETESTLLLFNPSTAPQKFTVLIHSGPSLWQRVYVLEPTQTEAISFRGLIQDEVKDDKGRILPKDAQSGEVDWFSPVSGKGRLLQSNPHLQMARSFSCGYGWVLCGTVNNTIGGTISVGASNVSLGGIEALVCSQTQTCTGYVGGVGDNGYTYDWSSLGSSSITIAGSSLSANVDTVQVNGVGGGSATVQVDIYDPHCHASAQGKGTVQVPTSLQFISVSVLPDGTSGAVGCPSSSWSGIRVDIKYQVLDQQSPP
jgi:hypothetical protein